MTIPICIVGTVATAPKLALTRSGVAFCTFRVASNERRYDREQGQWVDGETNWFTVNAFRGLAEHASESFAKGDRVVVSGRVRMRRWESGEKSGTAVEIEAEALGHDLRWGVTTFAKRHGSAAASATNGAAEGRVDTEVASDASSRALEPGEQREWRVTGDVTGETAPDARDEDSRAGDGFVPAAA
ncbi:single-stranded DNA-binding protein [Leucobacter triazinivorans]|uniref:Single-stranded DNA-binding protein n=1 Tax=Leucobacter triazinivorans TaxID=1784719 RepID=A0A4P6KHB8_9MICO|nr:single-stranded DNA-binding protein [Leucobacter triazinivorans]QBE49937.1 single-stranded DNA-binding protein [Leucobacter triazinivorans]